MSHVALFGPYTQVTSTFSGQSLPGTTGAKVGTATGATGAGTGMTLGDATGTIVGSGPGIIVGNGNVGSGNVVGTGSGPGIMVGRGNVGKGNGDGTGTGDPAGAMVMFNVSTASQSGAPAVVFTPTVATMKN